ncbi:MAG: hypothetical protein KFB96_05990 [Thiocapsa sp.]|uniref:hypothetical protein n=1 Tax=Thiocapsa sp. TaxID=2024551 RepID=UPI001BD1B27D|nr:hypothetical protein [Thiocapsa sp.]QVL50020.1 MAG: hypothetical protein KFB96_05990 [Thiocapsa sp.]
MLPSLVVDEVRRGVAETLRAQFEPSTALFKDAVRRLIDEPTWFRGPPGSGNSLLISLGVCPT